MGSCERERDFERADRDVRHIPSRCDVPAPNLEDMVPEEYLGTRMPCYLKSAKWMLYGIIHAFPVLTMAWIRKQPLGCAP